ncbi:DNA-binding protein [Sulfurospirillum diekertiae]|uniref:DNA-binding protein n=1 Tax=Sulfurospirillum diekertiae TaxID=1854492 RepID=A0A290HR57_9BACT|nr:helix-turn-helix domain-containing protein [Sulfurospirillum diekertiae]ATB69124.1 DNA-binding protein [Sulfurospirillum diekertiae]
MMRNQLVTKIEQRRKQLKISLENLSKLSNLGMRTLNRFLAGDDVKLSTVESITNILGLDFAGNEVVPLIQLQKNRAYQKAQFMASLVQSTSALEMQGLEKEIVEKMIAGFEQAFLSGEYKKRLWVA